VALLAAVAAVTVLTAPPSPASAAKGAHGGRRMPAKVIEALDGETLRVRLQATRRLRRVRLLGVDAPESQGAGAGLECGGEQALATLRHLADGRLVTLAVDPTQGRVDSSGLLLAYATGGGRDVNLALIRRGWAKVHLKHDRPFERLRAFRRAQRAARRGNRGAWRLCGGRFHERVAPAAGSGTAQPAPPAPPDTEEPEPEPEPVPGCESEATSATSAGQLIAAVEANEDVCVTAPVGDFTLDGLGARSLVISTEGNGSMGAVAIEQTSGVIIRSARLRSIELREADDTELLGDVIGGTKANRVEDELIFMPDESNDVEIRGNDIGWTKADNSGNTGYGCRCYGNLNGLRFVSNKVHDIAADGFQGVGGENVLIDRNEIGPVGANPDSDEHSDNIQIVDNDANLRITNNWIHDQGYYEGEETGSSGSTYIHGDEGAANSVFYENNLIEHSQGRTEICGLGTGGTSRSNITVRNNTWVEGGLAYNGFPGFSWECDTGSGNTVARNIAIDSDGGFAQNGSASSATFSANLWGQPSLVTLDSDGNCTSSNCNPAGQEPIGYRKPSNVSW
jgi:endonuclease YncB( thermonuclease family)